MVKFQGCVDSIGTQLDSEKNRGEIKRLRSVIKSKVTSAKSNLKESKKTSQNKIMMDRQTNQLESQISKFQSLLEKEKASVRAHPTAPAYAGKKGGPNCPPIPANLLH